MFSVCLLTGGGGGYLSHNALQHEPPPPPQEGQELGRTGPPKKDQNLEGPEPPPPKELQNFRTPELRDPPPLYHTTIHITILQHYMGPSPHYTTPLYTSLYFSTIWDTPPLYHTTILQHYRDPPPQVWVQGLGSSLGLGLGSGSWGAWLLRAGGTPLAVTQEDCLVLQYFGELIRMKKKVLSDRSQKSFSFNISVN